jgi:hypothetical protein
MCLISEKLKTLRTLLSLSLSLAFRIKKMIVQQRRRRAASRRLLRFFSLFLFFCFARAQKKNDFSETLRILQNEEPPRTTCLPSDEFVKVSGNEFILNGKPFTFAGWNQWEVVEASSNAPPVRLRANRKR